VHEGDVVMVEGKVMHEPKASALAALAASALAALNSYYIFWVH